jgi:hypothetical protein
MALGLGDVYACGGLGCVCRCEAFTLAVSHCKVGVPMAPEAMSATEPCMEDTASSWGGQGCAGWCKYGVGYEPLIIH